jgi:O-methyltransferase domain/Dimerisation domain
MTERPPESQLWDLLRGALGTRAIALAAELEIADMLADGPRSAVEVAHAVRADPDTLRRLLRALASDGVFAETAPGVFVNTPASELLRRGGGWNDFARLFGGVWYRTAEGLDATGEPAFPRLFGTDFWSWLAAHPDARAAFDRAMEQGKERRVEQLAGLDWRGDETVVDVGGGNGSLLLQVLERIRGLRGIVFDLPETVRDGSAFGERCTFVEGSFFDRVPEGDVYILSTILHDWDDASATAILRTIREAAPTGARLFVIDSVIPEGNEAHGAKWLDLLMLALLAGRERDEAQWRALLASGGFEPLTMEDGLIEARCRS